ncbi:MAG: T9SS type A sorting domain-containing protein, partial [Bacteroidetes bacterium]|nr:T9SS type A sorting domain-containing protein [Bacteroidota bacterium]
ANGCINDDSIEVMVNQLPAVIANATSTALCDGDSVTLSGSGADVYSWDNNVVNEEIFMPVTTNTYTVTGTDVNGCVNTDEIIVIVNPLPVVIANASSNVICDGDEVTLTGTGANTYTWDNGVTDGIPLKINALTTFTVTGTDVNGCVNTDEVEVDVNQLPVVTLEDFNMICVGHPKLELTGGKPTGGFYSITTGIITHFEPTVAGDHTITYEYMDVTTGCTNIASKDIVVDPCTGIANAKFSKLEVKVYPNPAANYFNLEINTPENEVAEILIFNSNGKLISNEKLSLEPGVNKVAFNSTQYARGIYIMRVLTKTNVINQRIVLN